MSNLTDAPQPLYYSHTGTAPFFSTTVAAIASWLAVSVLAVAYGYADLHFKVFDIVSALILGLFAAGMGLAVFGIIRSARVRSIPVTIVISVSSAVLALYVSWVAWEYFLIRDAGHEPPFFTLFGRPGFIWGFARDINAEGTFSLRSSGPVTGTFLWIIWIAEAISILLCVGLLPPQMLRTSSFCETCNRWCPKPKSILRTVNADEEQLRSNMEQKNFSYLAALAPADRDTGVHIHVELTACDTCDEMNLLSVTRAVVGRDGKGNRTESLTKIVSRLHLSAEEAEEVRDLKSPPPSDPAPNAAPPTPAA